MDQFPAVIESITKLYQLVAANTLAATLMVAGLVLIVLTCILAVKVVRSKPEELPIWMRAAFFACLGFGVLFVIAGPTVSWVELTRGGIRRVPLEQSFANLGENARVTWLVRLIPY